MRAHYLQHVSFEGLGVIKPWLDASGYEITHTRFFETTGLPDANDIDLLIVMGGPMSANDEREFPWLKQEKEFISEAIGMKIPVLGICLGAQLIASALGAQIYRNPEKEIGWYPLNVISSQGDSSFRFPSSTMAFHWHGETFDLPTGAVHLASSEACINQAFQVGNSVIGLQFHLEVTPETLRGIVTNCSGELIPSRWVQDANTILYPSPIVFEQIHSRIDEILSFLTQ
jgi:GMP synthase-like glutamine amidotransferase